MGGRKYCSENNPTTRGKESEIDDIAFLSRSGNRIDALCALAEHPCSRTELRAIIDASESTICRLLREFETRNWANRDGHHYRTTELGEFVAGGFVDLIGRMETERTLGEMVEWLSIEPSFDVNRLADAEIIRPSQSDPLAPITRAGELVGAATRLRVLTHNLPRPSFDPQWRAVTSGRQRSDLVVTPSVIEEIDGSAIEPQFEEVVDSEEARVYVYDDIPQIIVITDDVVLFGIDDENGAPLALIETDDETVVSWAEDTFETHRRKARLLSRDLIKA